MTQSASKGSQNLKKYAVFAVMFAVFAASMWLIFAPSSDETAPEGVGFNSDIPDPRGADMVGDKKTAYEQEQARERQQDRMRSLQDYSYLLGNADETPEERAAREERELRMAPKPPEYYENPERFEGNSSTSRTGYTSRRGNSIEASGSAHANLAASLNNFYEEPKTDPEKEAMQAEIDQLKSTISAGQNQQSSLDDQVALLEKSFEIASRYMPNQNATPDPEPSGDGRSRRANVEPVSQVTTSVVSALAQPMSDAEFVRQFSRERNFEFVTATAQPDAGDRNTIAAVVHGDQILVNGQSVRLRTTEPMRAGRQLIPRNTIISGAARISGERLEISITAIEHDGNIIPVELSVYDSDGQPGIYIPGSMEITAVKEVAANMGQSLGTTINLNQQSAGEQLLTDLGRGAIQGTSQYIARKAREIKVTLKSGYRLFLLPDDRF